MTVFTPFEKTSSCFSGLIKLEFDPTKKESDALSSKKGVKVRIYG